MRTMRIEATLESNLNVNVKCINSPKTRDVLGIMYYGIIRAMKEHDHDAFMFAMDKFISEELDE